MSEVSHTADDFRRRLGSSEVRSLLEGFVRRRVPPGEVDDVVQTVLVDALEAPEPPEDEASLRRWVVGIARHKVADFHRKNGRAKSVELSEHLAGDEPPISAREWAKWAEKHTDGDPDAQRTLDWMAREGDGEKLAHIAEDERLAPTQVRQRVSRLRRRLKAQWKAELAAVAIVLTLAFVAWRLLREPVPQAITPEPDRVEPDRMGPEEPRSDPVPGPLERAADLRRAAFEACESQRWQPCLDRLDEARRLDPAGDAADDVRRARETAERGLAPPDEKSSPPPTSPESERASPKNATPPPKRPPVTSEEYVAPPSPPPEPPLTKPSSPEPEPQQQQAPPGKKGFK
jgi:DNA-directed RNA polymerase specialized sigma24 family protein